MSLVAAKGGADVGATSSILLPMTCVVTIVTTFLSPHIIRFGWKLASRRAVRTEKPSTVAHS